MRVSGVTRSHGRNNVAVVDDGESEAHADRLLTGTVDCQAVRQVLGTTGLADGANPTVVLPVDLGGRGTEIDTRVAPVQCLIVADQDLAEVVNTVAAYESGAYVPVDLGGQTWTVVFRPMLPDETSGCAQLEAQ